MSFRSVTTTFADPGKYDDDPREDQDSNFPHDEFACLDANTCSNDGGCEFITACGVTRCRYCKTVVA